MKRVIQTYKAPAQWVDEPPGLGDFVRGGCHLFEKLRSMGIEFRVDVSQTEYVDLIEQDKSIFQAGDVSRIASAEEYFENEEHIALSDRLMSFLHSNESELYVSTNLGAWDRTTLPQSTREFIARFYRFKDEIECMTAQSLQVTEYEVLSVRCGDDFFGESNAKLQNDVLRLIFSIIERHVMARAQLPVVVTSDCHELKVELAHRYGMLALPHRSRHGAFGGVLPVAMDMCMLKNSRFNYHINCFADWWSGFSHYTSMIFTIPSMNFRAPRFAKEEITAQGRLVKARPWWSALKRA